MILWEIMNDAIPFANTSISDVKRLIADEKLRPKIAESMPEEIAALIRCCWQDDAMKSLINY